MDSRNIKEIKNSNQDISKILNLNKIIWEGGKAPGPNKLIGGNLQAGFYGECPASEFISGDELARQIGLTVGTSQFSNEPWLKFSYLGKVEYIAKKPFRYSISWDDINVVNAVFGDRTVMINNKTYKLRLMKGKTEGRQDDKSSDQGDINKGSEWNKLMLPIHQKAPSDWAYRNNVNLPTENWNVGYTDIDLFTSGGSGRRGFYSWCQEYGKTTNDHLIRGTDCISGSRFRHSSFSAIAHGWRPVLELVE